MAENDTNEDLKTGIGKIVEEIHEEAPNTELSVAPPDTSIVDFDSEDDVLNMLAHNMDSGGISIPYLKFKKDKKTQVEYAEIKMKNKDPIVVESLKGRILLQTTMYQYSETEGKEYTVPAHTTEDFHLIKQPYILWRKTKEYTPIEKIEDFRNEFPPVSELPKGKELKRMTVLYIYLEKGEHNEAGLVKCYLKMSQSIGCKEGKETGFRFDDPLENSFEYRRKKDKYLVNKIFTMSPKTYAQGDIDITYPVFTDPVDSPIPLQDLIKEAIGVINQTNKIPLDYTKRMSSTDEPF